MILVSWLAMSAVMAVLWLVQRRTGDAGIVDLAWGLGVGILAAVFAGFSFDGDLVRRWVVGGCALLWALRLSGHIGVRLMTLPEDGRYRTLKQHWGASAQSKMFVFYQVQAIGSVLFALPMLVAANSSAPWGWFDWAGLAVWSASLGGEAWADRQLARFRADPARHGQVCRIGWWRYSRHPNYFFEWLHWWSYVLWSAAAPWGWLTILAPAAMLYLLLRVTGIPPTEAQAVRSKGDAYREYQRTTSALIPWPPKAGVGR